MEGNGPGGLARDLAEDLRRRALLATLSLQQLRLIAKVACLSRARLERAMWGGHIRPKTRRRIERALAELGWVVPLLPAGPTPDPRPPPCHFKPTWGRAPAERQ